MRPFHALEPACQLLATVSRTTGEAAQTLLHLPPGPFTDRLAANTRQALMFIRPAAVVSFRPAWRAALRALAVWMVLLAAAGPLGLAEVVRSADQAAQALAHQPPRPWVVTLPPDPAVRPYIVMVTAAPAAKVTHHAPPRLVWQAGGRRRVITLQTVGGRTYLLRLSQVRRPASFAVIGQTHPAPFNVDPAPATAAP
jgi:hypothetical protein